METLTLADLLGELREAGTVESRGNFSLDLERAAQNLSRFRLPKPEFYILRLLQAGVAGKAKALTFKASLQNLELGFPGLDLEQNLLQNLLSYIIEDSSHRTLSHLASGIYGSLSVAAKKVELASAGYRYIWEVGSSRQESDESSQSGLHLRITRPPAQVLRGWGRGLGQDLIKLFRKRGNSVEAGLIARFGDYYPIPISINGTPLERAPFGKARFPGYRIETDPSPEETAVPLPQLLQARELYSHGFCHRDHHLVERYVAGPGCLIAPSTTSATELINPELAGRPCQMLLGLRALDSSARLLFVRDGILVDERQIDLDIPGLLAIVSADELRTDLGGFEIVEDASYRELLQRLRQLGGEMLDTLSNSAKVPARLKSSR